MSTAPHLWRLLLEARRAGAKLVVVDPCAQPHGARGRRAPAPAARHRRRAGDGDDARGAWTPGWPTRTGAASTPTASTSCSSAWTSGRVEEWAELCGVPAEDVDRVGREFASTEPALLRLGVGAQRHLGAPAAYSHRGLPARADRRVAPRGRRLLLHPHRHRGRRLRGPAKRDDLRPGEVRRINMSQVGHALTDPALDPPVAALVVLDLQPRPGRARAGARCWRACAATTSSPWCSSSS